MNSTPMINRSADVRSEKGGRVWIWVVIAFAIQATAWTAWFVIASHNHVEEVPLVTGVSNLRHH